MRVNPRRISVAQGQARGVPTGAAPGAMVAAWSTSASSAGGQLEARTGRRHRAGGARRP